MSEKNVLLRMTLEKLQLIHQLITEFLGHDPSTEEKKDFKIMHQLGQSLVYYQGKLIGFVKNEPVEEEGSSY